MNFTYTNDQHCFIYSFGIGYTNLLIVWQLFVLVVSSLPKKSLKKQLSVPKENNRIEPLDPLTFGIAIVVR